MKKHYSDEPERLNEDGECFSVVFARDGTKIGRGSEEMTLPRLLLLPRSSPWIAVGRSFASKAIWWSVAFSSSPYLAGSWLAQ